MPALSDPAPHADSPAGAVARSGAETVSLDDSARCPCQSGEAFGSCCGPYLSGQASPPTVERLMRSRYTAFAVRDAAYLLHSWHPSTRPATLELEPGIRWFRLDILDRVAGGLLDSTGIVEFEARYRMPPAGNSGDESRPAVGIQHERSRFERAEGRWTYVDGE
ncbi:MAG: hypothetical protein EPO52_07730 [Herbiconiux sp.]|uniref:YchJ family protein n=1 Tax=Herbiconiux sp. TaxID=1871186 RepID=UPI0011FEBEBB|nr:YchJ family metal-binding protein [Herbiconiux sp.]TAJ48059.1 MAG: hypothetical protein EPO52_07730 [Herbiconiux sp.]